MRLAPWHVKGIGPQARETAREAARRSGMSVGQWLNAVILDQADGVDDDTYEDAPAYREPGDDLASITGRLDDLGRQIERLAGRPANPADRDGDASQRIADAIQHLNGRLDRLITEERNASSALERRVNSVDQALAKLSRERVRAAASYAGVDPVSVSVEQATAEVAARQRALDAEFAAPASDILRGPALSPFQCRADAAVDSLRKDLTEIGRVISEAMPREAVEALEGEVRALGGRLDSAHRSTANAPAVASLERGLHEVRDALRGLAPAENLTGFNEAIRKLSSKIDALAGVRQDPAGLRQLEAATASLRSLVGQVASADALASLSQEVRSLAERIDRGTPASGGAEVLVSLDRRIASIADAIETVRGQPGRDSSPQIDRLVNSLSEKIDRLQDAQSAPRGEQLVFRDLEDSIAKLSEKLDASQGQLGHLEAIERDMAELSAHLKAMQAPPVAALDYREAEPGASLSRGEQIALGGLEDRIAKLSEKLDASEGRLGHLASIERGMAELLTHLEVMRAAPSGGRESPPQDPVVPPIGPPVETLSHDIAALKQAQSVGERRSRDSLEDVQGTIETVVDRLATIETTIRNDPRGGPLPPGPEPAPEPGPVPSPAPAPHAAPALPAPPANPARSARPSSGPRRPIDPSLPADHPLEPGSGPPRPRPAASASPTASSPAVSAAGPATKAADRVAAAEAPLRAPADAPAEPDAKSNYLQAARRAAQMAQAAQRGERAAAAPDKPASKLPQRIKTVLVAASVAAIILAALHFVATFFFEFAELTPPQAPALAERQAPDPDQASADEPTARQVPVIVARPAAAPSGAGPQVVVVPPITQPFAPSIASPIAPAVAPSIAPPVVSGNPLFAPYVPPASVPSALPRAEQALAPSAAPPTGVPSAGDVTGAISPPSASRQIPPAAPSPLAAPAADRLPPGIGGPALIAAANAGEPAAAYEVATRFAEGRRVPQSFAQAAIWYERAAKGGLAPALFRLGALYEKGEGVTKDPNEARRLYLAAADKGNVNAMHNIGVLYAEGIDGKPDFKSAAQWFRKSALYGVADSQYNLAVLYARGIGLERDFAEAFRWFSLAAKSGDADAAKKRDEIAAHLDAKTLSVARQAVDAFAPQQPPEEAATVKPPAGGWDQAQPVKRKPTSSARARSKAQAI